jgi:hypothetical protein
MAHTPGPWGVANKTGVVQTVVGFPILNGLGLCESDYIDRPTAEANARLIAAAPALLEALSDLLRVIDRDDPWVRVTTYNPTHEASIRAKRERARAALRQARGGGA